jgi:hypothetical protein
MLREVFDSYRQSIGDQYDDQWRKKYAWLNLAHVCRRWRAVMFASYSRLDLNIVVGPEKPSCIKATLRGRLPILIDYFTHLNGTPRAITESALWRMRAALRHRDRVREISFGGWVVDFITTFIRATNHHFPALESLSLGFPAGQEPAIPATFLRGPDQSDLRLRRLGLYGGSLPSVSGLLMSATALTDLTLNVPSNPAPSTLSQESILLPCLQGMQCLRSLNLTIDTTYHPPGSESQLSTPEDIVPLLKLTNFRYSGTPEFLNNFISRLSTPSLQDAHFVLRSGSPFLNLSRVIDDLREEFRSIRVIFGTGCLCLLLSTQLGKTDHFKPSFSVTVDYYPYPLGVINRMPSTKLAMAEDLALKFPNSKTIVWGNVFSLREFLRQFRSVRVLRVSPFLFMKELALYLQQDDGEAVLPLLEEIELSDEEYQRLAAEAVAAFQPIASARERAGRLVNVYRC